MNQELARALVDEEDHDEYDFFEAVTDEELTDKTRWKVYYQRVFKDTRDNTFWRLNWDRGATEYQEGSEEVYVTQVEPKEKTVIVYQPVKAK